MTAVDSKGGYFPAACRRRDVARKLVYWDELQGSERTELEAHASSCVVCGPRLSILKRSQQILESASVATSECPTPEELYDFGRGPGHGALAAERLTTIQSHVVNCRDCQENLATLETRPPLPLDLSPPPEAKPAGRKSAWRWPLAAAAGLAAAALVWELARQSSPTASAGPEVAEAALRHVYPELTAMRGLFDGDLLYPRGDVLGTPDSGPYYRLSFETRPQEGATEYRVQLYRQTEDVFVPGKLLSVFRHSAHRLQVPASVSTQLTPGGYTWEAWCVVDGLDKFLGRLDFDIIQEAELLARLAHLERLEEPQRGNSILTLLHGNHLETDLRSFARTLPPSPERDRFLSLPR